MTAASSHVAILGAGLVNPVATGMLAFEQALRRSEPALVKLEGVPLPRGKGTVGLVTDPLFAGPEKGLRMALAAATEALTASSIDTGARGKAGLILATMAGDSHAAESCYPILRQLQDGKTGGSEALADAVRSYPNGALLQKLCRQLGMHGPRFAISNACASGNIAIGLALDLLRSGRCETVLVVGVEVLKLSMLWGAERAGFVGTALRPFHAERDGAILGEGAAAIVMSKRDLPAAQGALGWVEGFGSVCDRGAAAITLAADGSGLERAMQLALDDAGRNVSELEYVNAHAPGTRMIDAIECAAVARLCGDTPPAINASKSITAHLSGASAITEVIATLVQMRAGFVHGNASLDSPDPALALVPVGVAGLERALSFGLSNACGGGGLNTSIALSSAGQGSITSAFAPAQPGVALVFTGSGAVRDTHLQWQPRGAPGGERASAHLPDFNSYRDYPVESNYHHMNRAAQLAASAAARALRSAAIAPRQLPCADDRFAVIFGTCVGGAPQASKVICDALLTNPNAMTPSMSLDHGIHLGAALVCRHYGLTGTTYTVTGSRHAGLQALEIGALSIQAGRADAALVAGFDSRDPFETQLLESLQLAGEQADAAAAVVLEQADAVQLRAGQPIARLLDIRTLAGTVDDTSMALQLGRYLAAQPWEVLYLAASQPARYQCLLDQALELVRGRRACLQLADDLPDQRAGLGISAVVDAIAGGRTAAIIAPSSDGVITVVIVAPPL